MVILTIRYAYSLSYFYTKPKKRHSPNGHFDHLVRLFAILTFTQNQKKTHPPNGHFDHLVRSFAILLLHKTQKKTFT